MSEYFDSLQQGKKTGARTQRYTAIDVAAIRKQTKMTQWEFSKSLESMKSVHV